MGIGVGAQGLGTCSRSTLDALTSDLKRPLAWMNRNRLYVGRYQGKRIGRRDGVLLVVLAEDHDFEAPRSAKCCKQVSRVRADAFAMTDRSRIKSYSHETSRQDHLRVQLVSSVPPIHPK